jgi:tRNA pseudouridine55 synthase
LEVVKLAVDGALVIDKPAGPTSHDVVARVRRATGMSRIGHTGTLDPLATGVLPLVIGRATRLAQFLMADRKEYLAEVRFGATSATYDAEGPIAAGAGSCTADDVAAALEAFRGTFQQTPPPYSAKKVEGTRAYKLARRDQTVAIAPVAVTVDALDLLAFDQGTARLRVVSSSGFYVRSLAHDLGQRVGCGAYLESLRRTRAGAFDLAAAVPLDAVEREGAAALERVIPMERLLPDAEAVRLTAEGVRRASHGNTVRPSDVAGPPPGPSSSGLYRLLGPRDELVALADARPDGALHPTIVLV